MTRDNDTSLSGLRPGVPFGRRRFVARNIQSGRTGSGPGLTLTLRDASCPEGVRAVVWHPTEEMRAALADVQQNGGFVWAEGVLKESPEYGRQIILTVLAPAEPPEDLTPFLPPPPPGHRDDWNRFVRLFRSVREPHLRQLLAALFPKETQAAFRRAVAAAERHHAGPGGLLRHTIEVAELADAACALFPGLRRDLLITGALLHDYGKLTEMEHGIRAGEYTPSGCLEGHIAEGHYRIRRAAEEIPGFPEGLRLALGHLVLSHHGRLEWGAAREPALPEAIVLAACDKLSADTASALAAVADAPSRAGNRVRSGEYRLFVGGLGLEERDFGRGGVSLSSALPSAPEPSPNRFGTASVVRLPILGTVAAGPGDVAAAEPEGYREVAVPPGGADYLLRVTGDSMTGEGIREGDLVLVRLPDGDRPRSGELIVAHLPGASGGVVKRFAEDTSGAWLVSANPVYPPLPVTPEVRFQGRVAGLLRDY